MSTMPNGLFDTDVSLSRAPTYMTRPPPMYREISEETEAGFMEEVPRASTLALSPGAFQESPGRSSPRDLPSVPLSDVPLHRLSSSDNEPSTIRRSPIPEIDRTFL